MTILIDVFKELFKMFVADLRLTLAVLAGVAILAALLRTAQLDAVWGGLLLLIYCLAVLAEAVLRETRKRARTR